ncbi:MULTISPECIES: erythromycin esterase family protein [Clostridiaceae]|uniref:erythromycin esterase family protein n=1 Tax=Clostridiaceae TaxID=31979 RepID=UPI00054E2A04|nr:MULTISPECIES: erythromycin esterase family protein [Clostridiaceae]
MKKRLLSVLVVLLICLNFVGCSKTGTDVENSNKKIPKKAYIEYLEKNTKNLDVRDNEEFSSYTLLNSDVKDKEIFLIGEAHNIDVNYDIKWKFMKYFKKETNFKYLIIEYGFLDSLNINKYVETGNENYLKKVFMPNLEDYEFFRKMYRYNMSLSDKDKITVVGIDTIPSIDASQYLVEKLKDKNLLLEQKMDLQSLKEIYMQIQDVSKQEYGDKSSEDKLKDNYMDLKKKVNNVYNKIYNKEKYYREILNEEEFNFFIVLDNLKSNMDTFDFSKKGNSIEEIQDEAYLKREGVMYENFKKIYSHFQRGKYFGQMGLYHVFLHKVNINWFGARVNEGDKQFRNKVISIPIFYKECTNSKGTPISTYKDSDDLDKVLKQQYSLIKLNGSKSPFSKELRWDFINTLQWSSSGKTLDIPRDGMTTDYFQYMIIVKDANGATTIKD